MATRIKDADEGGEPLKNGTTNADDFSDDSPANILSGAKVPAEPTFQDGGQREMEYPPSQQHYQQNYNNNNQEEFRQQDYKPDYKQQQQQDFNKQPDYNKQDYNKQQDFNKQPQDYNNYDPQHGDYKMYPQYANQQMRPPRSPRYPAAASGSRFGPQTGPTPTLNQLLQAPNNMQRYQNNYEYQNKGEHYPNNAWRGPYPQQQQMYRNQGGDVKPRSYPMSSPGYPSYRHPIQGGQQQQQYASSGVPPYDGAGGQRGQPPQQPPQHMPPTPPTPAANTPQQQQQPPPPQQQPQPPPDGCSNDDVEGGVQPPPPQPLRATPPHPPSPSMSPALGQPPPNLPMPPRPSSTQSESAAGPPAQGYNQQMAPPGMYGGNKMGSSHPYAPSYPQQGGYHRPPMHNYSGQQQQPPTGGSNYPAGYPRYPYGGGGGQPPYPPQQQQQYGGMPPPNHYPPKASPPAAAAAGAQAAAQAAVIAAAASSSAAAAAGGGPVRQSPQYLRQHLQQKMQYNSGSSFGPTEQPPTTIGVTQQTTNSPSTVPSPSEMMSPRNSMGPPPLMDEGSQASNASASSSLPEERVETPKPKQQQQPMMSHNNAMPSPGAASMSSFHDDFESVSSPSWPRTPASPVINNQPYDHHPIKRPDGMLKLYDMSDEGDRRVFLDKLILYQEERGTPLSQCPTISKQPLDLYRLYLAAKERGGFVEVMKGKLWKEIAGLVGIGASSSAAYTLRKQYIKHLLPYECKYDRGGIDPAPLISSLESTSRKKAKNAQGGPMMDGYPYPGGGGGGYPPHPGMEYPPGGHYPPEPPMHHPPNHSEGAMDPFSDEQQPPYPSRPPHHNSSEGGGYAYPPTASPYAPPAAPPPFGGYGGEQQAPYGGGGGEPYPPPGGVQPEGGYGGRGVVPPDPYAPPPGGYPPNRTVGPAATAAASQYGPPYQGGGGEQERFPEAPTTPGPMLRPSTPNSSSSVIGPQPDPAPYPRYPSQPMGGAYPRGPAPSQYPNSQPPAAQYTPDPAPYNRGGAEFQQPQMSRLQSTLIQRLLPKNNHSPQGYNQPPGQQQQGGYGGAPPNKVAPPGSIPPAMYQRDMYPPKREYPPHYPPNTPASQPPTPYSDRSQYQYRPTHGMPTQSAGPPPPQQPGGWPRDGRPYPSGAQYQRGDNWEGGGPQWGPRYPQAEGPYHMGGPKMMSRAFPHNKMQPGPQSQYAPHPSNQRRELHFPTDSVESTAPVVVKRRRILSRDLPTVDPWRVMMALKSGLLGESTWALDVLGILLSDDSTVLYFGLAHLPGLLEVLMDHYRRCLNLVFGDVAADTEVGCCNGGDREAEEKQWWEVDDDRTGSTTAENKTTLLELPKDEGRQTLLDTTNYTNKTRCRKTVKTEEAEALFLFDRRWDTFEGHVSGSSHWAHGGGEATSHLQTHFEGDGRRVRFVRVLQDKDCPKKEEEGGSGKENCTSNPQSDSVPRVSKDPSNDKDPSKDSEIQNQDSSKPKTSCDEPKTSCEEDFPKIRSTSQKRRLAEDLEDESYARDEPSLCTITDSQDSLSRRCVALSTILRNLSFVPGNDAEMSKHAGFLLVVGRLLLLHHTHNPRRQPQRHYNINNEEDGLDILAVNNSAKKEDAVDNSEESEWWWETLYGIRDNTLVTLANICGQLDLAPFPEEISFPILDGLVHWATCPSSKARDPTPLSPQRLSLEALSKLSVLESNVDLMLATPPWTRTDTLLGLLARWLARSQDQVLREFSVVLLSNLSQAGSAVARAIALQPACIPLLLTFVEQAEQSALQVANAQGVNALRENPELMGTTLDMVRRAAGTLRCLARVPTNRTLFLQHQSRLLALVMSQILDQGVASIVADVLYECTEGGAENDAAT